ncbi:hypothetical protein D3C87_796300 [compost metagenome]
MFRHVLVKAQCRKELVTALGIGPDDLRLVRFRPFETRLATTEFLQHKLNLLRSHKAIAAPVKLPNDAAYTDAVATLNALGERLRMTPAGWQASKAQTEKKIVEQYARLSYMEQEDKGTQKELYWLVFIAEEANNVQHDSSGPQLQQAH